MLLGLTGTIIGLNGTMGAGKSTAAEVIRKCAGDDRFKLIKLAAPLYDIQRYIYDRISPVYKRPEGFVKDRTLLQWLGTDWGRNCISETLWIDLWAAEAKEALRHNKVVVVDDVRFDNEAKAIRKLNGLIINIKSPNSQQQAIAPDGILYHPTERGINPDLISRYIVNSGSKEEFEKNFAALLIQENIKISREASWF